MAANKFYSYYLRGSQIALIEQDINDNSRWKSPVASITDGLEIEYAYSPRYTLPPGSQSIEGYQARGIHGWTAVDGYLTFIRSDALWADWATVAANEYIVVQGSARWNGLHKVQEVQNWGDTTHGGVKTYTKVNMIVPNFSDSSVAWETNETITGLSAYRFTEQFTEANAGVYVDGTIISSATTTPYLWIMGSDASVGGDNNGFFSDWTFYDLGEGAGGELDLSSGYRYNWDDSNLISTKEAPVFVGDTSENVYIYQAFKDDGAYFLIDINTLNDESDTIDLPEYLAKGLVYYVKAKIAEDRMDIEAKEYFMREFRKMVEKQESSKIWGARLVVPASNAIR